ncbi:MAG: DUF2520 domain-containing protein [Pricia sp.]
MIRVSILGTGNVATHLFRAFLKSEEIEVVQVVGRNSEALRAFSGQTRTLSDFSNIREADVFIIAVKDDVIVKVSEYVNHIKGLVVHTSGSVSIAALSACHRYGVFYPLQSFSKDSAVDMRSVPICLEAHDSPDTDLLDTLATTISDKVYRVDSTRRKTLHLAAVFVNNFTNHLYHIGQHICEQNELPTEILQPLIRETAAKLERLKPYDAQTGPARRGDNKTIDRHLEQLKSSEFKEIYEMMSASIGKLYR